MKAAFWLAIALLAPIGVAQTPEENHCAILGVFSTSADATTFAKPLSRANLPVLMWASGSDHYVAVGPYASEKAAEAVLPGLRSRDLVERNIEGVVTSCSAS